MRVLIACEIGGGYGRVAQIAPLADALRARGAAVVATLPAGVLGATAGAAGVAVGAGAPADPAAAWQAAPVATREPLEVTVPRSYTDVLRHWHHGSTRALLAHAARWQAVIEAAGAEAVVLHHAPAAQLAALAMGLPLARAGDGYLLPPGIDPLPSTRPWIDTADADDARARAALDAATLPAIRAACEALDLDPPTTLGAWIAQPDEHLMTWPFLDHYGVREGAWYYGPPLPPEPAERAPWPADVVAYLSQGHPAQAALQLACLADGRRLRLHAPAAVGREDRTVRVDAQPFPLGRALAHATVLVNHASHGACARALAAGRPMLLLPTNNEQAMIAARLRALGVARLLPPDSDADTLRAALAVIATDASMARAAQAAAQFIAQVDPAQALDELAEDLLESLEAA